jgi:hypothetical protein
MCNHMTYNNLEYKFRLGIDLHIHMYQIQMLMYAD